MMGSNANQFNLPRIYFALERLKIGSWTRITLNLHDLLCKIEPSFQVSFFFELISKHNLI